MTNGYVCVAGCVAIVAGACYLKHLMMKPLFDSLHKHLKEQGYKPKEQGYRSKHNALVHGDGGGPRGAK